MRPPVLVVCLLAFGFATVQSPSPSDPQPIFAAARQALGGEAALSAVRSFVVSGTAQRKVGQRVVDQTVELAYEAPDRFVRTSSYDAMTGGPFALHLVTTTREGVRGADRIYQMSMEGTAMQPAPPVGSPTQREATERAAVRRQQQAFARVSLALFAASQPGYPLSFTSLGRVTLLDGTPADGVEGKSQDGDVVRILFEPTSHLPVMISWRELSGYVSSHESYANAVSGGVNRALQTITSGNAGVDGGAARKDAPGAGANADAPLPISERTLALSEFRAADGLNWPHRLVERADGLVLEDMRLGKFRVNAKIPADRFKAADASR
jgi:hypothetical protein